MKEMKDIHVALLRISHTHIHVHDYTYKSIVLRYKYTCCDYNFWHVYSGHIDVHADKKRFNFVSYLGTPILKEP